MSLERLEDRSTPAVVQFVVDTDSDQPDLNPGDNVPLTQAGKVSLRSVFDHVVANGNGNDSYVINFLFPPQAVLIIGPPPPPPPTMTIPLGSPLPAVVNRDIKIIGTGDRAVTLTRDPNAQPTDYYRFLSVGAVGKLEVDGLKMTGAINRGNLGGTIFNGNGGILTVKNCYFASNIAKEGGAIANVGELTVAISGQNLQSEFLGNTSEGFGGAIYTGAIGALPVANISGATFTDNVAGDTPGRLGSQKGGAIASNLGGLLSIAGCTFTNNRAKDGGAIYADPPGTINPNLLVSDSKFESNHANSERGNGGAAWIKDTNAKFTTCEFNSNQADNEGGGIFQDAGKLTLDTCTFSANVALGSWDGRFADDVANFVGIGNPTTVTLMNTFITVVVW